MAGSALCAWQDQYTAQSSYGSWGSGVCGKAGKDNNMSILSTTILAFSMSADAFAASVGKGVLIKKPKISHAARIGAIFGIVEAITPVLGWLAGVAASSFITTVDHWVAFAILAVIGTKMFIESFDNKSDEATKDQKIGTLILTAIGTSIDAMAVGATLAFLDISIWISALAIGSATFLMATIGIMTGHYIGTKGGKIAEAIGGLGLLVIGTAILYDHLDVSIFN